MKKKILLTFTVSLFSALMFQFAGPVHADTNYFPLAPGSALFQDWSNTNLITTNDDWSGVPSIMGYRGDDPTVVLPDNDPQTVLADYSGIPDVNANQSVPNVFATAGVTEFQIADPVVALAGSGASDFPNLNIRLDTTGCPAPANAIGISYNVRDIESSSDNSVQRVALQYRIGSSGNYTNIPEGYIADATTGPSLATLVTEVSLKLPAAIQGQPQMHLRILTSNASGNDEWIGIDDIAVICGSPTAAHVPVGGRVTTATGKGISNAQMTLIDLSSGDERYLSTNAFGYYAFDDVEVGRTYLVSVSAEKKYKFAVSSQVINLEDETGNVNFVSEHR